MKAEPSAGTPSVRHALQQSAAWLRVWVGIGGLATGLLVELGTLRIVVSAGVYALAAVWFLVLVRRRERAALVIAICLVIDVVAVTHVVLTFGPTHTVLVTFYVAVVLGFSLLGRGIGRAAVAACVLSYGGALLVDVTGIAPELVLEPYRAGAYTDAVLVTSIYLILVVVLTGCHLMTRIAMDEVERHARVREQLARAEQAMREARIQRQADDAQRLESLGRLSCGVAHDFNNLLTVILGYGMELRKSAPDDERVKRQLDEIVRAAENAAALTQQLLTFSRKQPIRPVSLDLNAAVDDVRAMLDRLIGEHIEVAISLDGEPPVIEADPAQVQQILTNLAVNARDAMPSGGRLDIATERRRVDAGPDAGPHGLPPGEYVVLRVRDSGVGMTAEVQSRIFEPFFTTKPPGTGTGLGLSTVYGIVGQSGGTIVVTSTHGEGTEFGIWFPLRAGMAESARPPLTHAPTGMETILLAEDEEPVRDLAAEILRAHGYRVLTAEDGAACLGLATATSAQLLVTDIVMPGMSGKELADRIRREQADLKVLYITGYAPDPVLAGWQADDEAPILQKPFAPGDLLRAVRSVLDADSPTVSSS